MEMLRLYHSIWRPPDGFFNRRSVVRTASDFGLAINVRGRVEQGLHGVLLCRHTQVTAVPRANSGSAEPICLQIEGRSSGPAQNRFSTSPREAPGQTNSGEAPRVVREQQRRCRPIAQERLLVVGGRRTLVRAAGGVRPAASVDQPSSRRG